MQQLQRQVQQLSRQVAAMSCQPTRRRRKRKNKQGNGTIPAAVVAPVAAQTAVNSGGGRRRRRGRGRQNSGPMPTPATGDVTVTKMEMACTIKVDPNKTTNNGHVDLVPDSFAWLKVLFTAYERVCWVQASVWYQPMCATTQSGSVAIGVDWDGSGSTTTTQGISAYSPSHISNVYAVSPKLVLPPSRLRGRLWYTPLSGEWPDKSPAYIRWVVEGAESSTAGKQFGYLWVQYTCVFSGTRP